MLLRAVILVLILLVVAAGVVVPVVLLPALNAGLSVERAFSVRLLAAILALALLIVMSLLLVTRTSLRIPAATRGWMRFALGVHITEVTLVGLAAAAIV